MRPPTIRPVLKNGRRDTTSWLVLSGVVLSLLTVASCASLLDIEDYHNESAVMGGGGTDSSAGAAGAPPGSSGEAGAPQNPSAGGASNCQGSTCGQCSTGETRACGNCLAGTQSCSNGVWSDCEGDASLSCVDAAPSGWKGPMGVVTTSVSAGAPSCAGTGYERQVLSLFSALDPGEASCSCECEPPEGMSCSQSITMQYTDNPQSAASCAMVPLISYSNRITLTADTCVELPDRSATFLLGRPQFAAGDCTPTLSETLVKASFSERVVGCESNETQAEGCGTGKVCTPDLLNPLESLCIYADGEQECPMGPYSEQHILYDGVDDERSCGQCNCGEASGECDGGVLFLREAGTNAACASNDVFVGNTAFGNCTTLDTNLPTGAVMGVPEPVGSCPPAGGDVQGAVSLGDSVTVCCLP